MGAFFADIEEPIIGKREPGMLVTDPVQAKEQARLQANVLRRQGPPRGSRAPDRNRPGRLEKAVLAEASRSDRWVVLTPRRPTPPRGARLEWEPMGSSRSVAAPRRAGTRIRLRVKTTPSGITAAPSRGPGGSRPRTKVPAGPAMAISCCPNSRLPTKKGSPSVLAHASATFEQSGFPAFAAIDGKNEPNNGWAIMGRHAGGPRDRLRDRRTGGRRHSHRLDFDTEPSARVQPHARPFPSAGHHVGHAHPCPSGHGSLAPGGRRHPRRPGSADSRTAGTYRRTVSKHRARNARTPGRAGEGGEGPGHLRGVLAPLPGFERIENAAHGADPTTRNWLDESGPQVRPAFPQFLTSSTASSEGDRTLTRLDLAHWLVSRENPLTARVFVNRLWKQFFGIGLSKTVDDLGSQGEWPAHQELLDWLSCEFVDSGWDVKHLVRTIVTSRTYRQVSTTSKTMLARDPENRILARQSRFRIPAELVRDNALAIAGLLTTEIGGPSVKPYQPDGYWENLNFPPRDYVADRGPGSTAAASTPGGNGHFLTPACSHLMPHPRGVCGRTKSLEHPQQAARAPE